MRQDVNQQSSGAALKGESLQMSLEIYNPTVVDKPLGQYSHVAKVQAAKLLFISGQLANDKAGNVVGIGDFEKQVEQSFKNTLAILESEGLSWSDIVQFTTYVTDSRFIPRLHQYRLAHFPAMFKDGKWPPNTLLVVQGLVQPAFLFEVHSIVAFRD
jgi:enamine deaminase RidA (YjgF/YER057c/UK114 family)